MVRRADERPAVAMRPWRPQFSLRPHDRKKFAVRELVEFDCLPVPCLFSFANAGGTHSTALEKQYAIEPPRISATPHQPLELSIGASRDDRLSNFVWLIKQGCASVAFNARVDRGEREYLLQKCKLTQAAPGYEASE